MLLGMATSLRKMVTKKLRTSNSLQPTKADLQSETSTQDAILAGQSFASQFDEAIAKNQIMAPSNKDSF